MQAVQEMTSTRPDDARRPPWAVEFALHGDNAAGWYRIARATP